MAKPPSDKEGRFLLRAASFNPGVNNKHRLGPGPGPGPDPESDPGLDPGPGPGSGSGPGDSR